MYLNSNKTVTSDAGWVMREETGMEHRDEECESPFSSVMGH
jgi:hypothetical protein